MSQSPTTSKYWHFRVNDCSKEQFEHLKQVDCTFMKIGEEEMNKTRPGSHFHTVIIFERSQRVSYVKKKVLYNQKLSPQDWHLSAKYTANTVERFVNYAIKEGTRYTKGTYIGISKGSVSDEVQASAVLAEQRDYRLAISDKSSEQTKEEAKRERMLLRLKHARLLNYDWFLMNDLNFSCTSAYKALLANCQHRSDLTNLDQLDNYYIYGNPGTGKSSAVNYCWPGCYNKLKTNEKWDSYSNFLPEHETVYFDELDTLDVYDRCMGGLEEFKTMTDVYPFPVRSNYASSQINIRPKRFVITSNFTPSQVFTSENRFGKKLQQMEMILKAFNRRFKVMHISEFQKHMGIRFDNDIKRTVPVEPEVHVVVEPVQKKKESNTQHKTRATPKRKSYL